jgi:hypothetical protein
VVSVSIERHKGCQQLMPARILPHNDHVTARTPVYLDRIAEIRLRDECDCDADATPRTSMRRLGSEAINQHWISDRD